MKVLIIDNYDSFTFNLYQYVGEILVATGMEFIVDVVRNDELSLKEIEKRKYDKIILSPGPGDPSDRTYFGVCADVIAELGRNIPVLGVCLGMQGIAHCYGGKVVKAKIPMHGKTSKVKHNGTGLFISLPQDLEVMRYHSLVVDNVSLPDCLEITATASSETNKSKIKNQKSKNGTEEIEIMGLRHKEYPIEGIQFHPESFATEGGKTIISNFLLGGSNL